MSALIPPGFGTPVGWIGRPTREVRPAFRPYFQSWGTLPYFLPASLLTPRYLSIKIIAINSTSEVAPVKAAAGDKVRMKVGEHAGERGLVEAVDGDKLMIRLEVSGHRFRVLPEHVTNLSLAARKAWVTGPDRAVGRRKGTKLCD